MTDCKYDLWTLIEPSEDDARAHLEVIISNAELEVIQAIKYKQKKVFVISEEQYDQVKKYLVV